MPDAPTADIEQGLTQRPHATACQTHPPTASPTWPMHSPCLPSEQGTTATDELCLRTEPMRHAPQQPALLQPNRQAQPKIPQIQRKSPIYIQKSRTQISIHQATNEATHTSRIAAMPTETRGASVKRKYLPSSVNGRRHRTTESVRRRRRAEMVRGGAARSPRQSPGGTPFPFPGHAIREYKQCQENMVRWALKGL